MVVAEAAAAVVADAAVEAVAAVVAEAAVASRTVFRGAPQRDHEGVHSAVFHQERLS